MITLALEFSSDRRSVAIGRGDDLLAEASHEGTVRTPVFALIAEAIADAGITREQIGRLLVGIGPGSHTGIRIGISAVQGWHLATGAETVAVNSLENLALEVGPRALLAVNAQRGEFASAWAEHGALVEPIRLRSAEELRAVSAQGGSVIGPDLQRHLPMARPGFPSARNALRLAARARATEAVSLAPVYPREASFVKAPAGRIIPGITD
jgi:tRNA threonylcarbamoyl adenosine modification protein YeaZ